MSEQSSVIAFGAGNSRRSGKPSRDQVHRGMFDVLSRAPARVAPIALVAPATVAILALIVVWACRFGSFDYDGSQLDSCF